MTSALGISIPDNWRTAPLKMVTSLVDRGQAPDYVDDGPVRAISQAANQTIGLAWDRTRFHNHQGDLRGLRGCLLPHDILVNSTGTGTLGRVGYFTHGPDSKTCMADGHVTVIRTLPKELDPRFCYYWLSSRPFQEFIQAALTVGATNQIELNRDKLRDAPVAAPPLDEQREIANFLDAEMSTMTRLATLRKRQIEIIKERHGATLDLAIEEHSQRFGTLPFRRHVTSVDQGFSPQCDAVSADAGEWGVLKVSCLRPGQFFADENKRLPTSEVPVIPYEVRKGDLLITRANTPALVGSTAVVPEVRAKLLLSDKIFRVRVGGAVDPQYIAAVAAGSHVRALCKALSNGASQSMANIRFEDVKSWPIPRADLSAQSLLVQRLRESRESLLALDSAIKSQLDTLAERREALITAAVTGQFDIPTARRMEAS